MSPYLNLDLARAVGIDFEIAYARDVDFFDRHDESLSIRMLGGKLDERSSTVVGGVPAEFAGTRGAAGSTVGVFADITANLTVSYRVARWSVQLQERYVDDVLLNRLWVEGVDVDKNTIDVASMDQPRARLSRAQMRRRGLVARVVERAESVRRGSADHPVSPANSRFGAQATDALYDECGRRYQLGFSMEF